MSPSSASCRSTWRKARTSILDKPELELALGQPVMFPLYTSTVRGDDKPGDRADSGSRPAAAAAAVAHDPARRQAQRHQSGAGDAGGALHRASARWNCSASARDGSNRWRLEFNVRDLVQDEKPSRDAGSGDSAGTDRHRRLAGAAGAGSGPAASAPSMRPASGDSDLTPQELTKALEAALDAPRHDWPTGLCRRLWDFLAEVADERRRSPAHLSRWYNLVGFCLRPGFGDPLDRFRIEQLWKLMAAPPRADAGKGARHAPRLPESGRRLLDHVAARRRRPALDACSTRCSTACGRCCCRPRARSIAKPGANELAEMWRAAASLERLDVKHKEALGDGPAEAAAPQPGADLRLLGADAPGGARAAVRPAQRRRASPGRRELAGRDPAVRAGQRERTAGLGVLPGAAGPPHRPARPRRRRQPPRAAC